MFAAISIFLFVVLVYICADIYQSIRRDSEDNDQKLTFFREQEKTSLAALVIVAPDERFSMIGHEATVISRIESIGYISPDHYEIVSLSSQSFLLNPSGEYFFWLWHSDRKHYIKHVSHVNAKIALRDEYIAPENWCTPIKLLD